MSHTSLTPAFEDSFKFGSFGSGFSFSFSPNSNNNNNNSNNSNNNKEASNGNGNYKETSNVAFTDENMNSMSNTFKNQNQMRMQQNKRQRHYNRNNNRNNRNNNRNNGNNRNIKRTGKRTFREYFEDTTDSLNQDFTQNNNQNNNYNNYNNNSNEDLAMPPRKKYISNETMIKHKHVPNNSKVSEFQGSFEFDFNNFLNFGTKQNQDDSEKGIEFENNNTGNDENKNVSKYCKKSKRLVRLHPSYCIVKQNGNEMEMSNNDYKTHITQQYVQYFNKNTKQKINNKDNSMECD